MEHTERPAQTAAGRGAKNTINASASPSQATASSRTAGTAPGAAEARAKIGPAIIGYAESRGISESNLERLPVAGATAWFRDQGEGPALAFQYTRKGRVVGTKYRSITGKAFTAAKGSKFGFWNLEQCLGSESVFIVEGELDAVSLVEAGVSAREVIATPGGHEEHDDDKPEEEIERGYSYVVDALAAGLDRTKRFILATDNDEVGHTLRARLAAIIGPARCDFLDWPAGIKDANQFLTERGAHELLKYVEGQTKPWPISGIYRISELPEEPPMTPWRCGFADWNGKFHLAPGTLSVVTGNAGSGKTRLMNQIWCTAAENHDLVVAMASFETGARPHHQRLIRQYYHKKPEHVLSPAEKAEADSWCDRHFLWMRPENGRPTFDWALQTMEAAALRYGANAFVLDPWNKLEHAQRPDERETSYIGRCLDALMVFAKTHNVHVMVIAHPAKIEGNRRNQAPYLEDISGSKHWDNKTDIGLVVHRKKFFDEHGNRLTDATLFVRKMRFEELGHPCALNVNLNLTTGIYEAVKS